MCQASALYREVDGESPSLSPATRTRSRFTPDDVPPPSVTFDYLHVLLGIVDVRDIMAELARVLKASPR
jgi:hypothetical protein